MRPSSLDRCLWRCAMAGCGHDWPASLRFRARRL
ncbi:hypothetical protein DP939_32020 [Spongiactinospora rosea]|uniref:Uncharacterized protein n=1 Tax=Spongiactinospora rosea TaxID=2248750 RepID=A0A366LS60_9ACTN|nr:hypothetical protein DP939_32020 [Spongiactinospora rosea]